MGPGDDVLTGLVRNSVAPATWAAYGKAWDGWWECVDSRPVHGCAEARLQTTLEFLRRLRLAGVSGTAAQHRITGLAFHFQLRGWENVGQHFVISRLLRGWKKERVVKDSRKPVSFVLLGSLIEASREVCSSPYEAALLSAAFALAFFGAFRVGELVPPSRFSPGGLRVDDVVVCADSLRIRLRTSKTDQLGQGAWVHLRSVQGGVCPFGLVTQFMVLRVTGDRFLSHLDGVPLTRFQFTSVFKKCLSAVGENLGDYGTHSFRIGAATEAVRAGLAEGDVMRIGRWQSRCYAGYVRPDMLS